MKHNNQKPIFCTLNKALALLCMLGVCFTLASCGKNRQELIKEELQGTWSATWVTDKIGIIDEATVYRYYIFNGDRYTTGGSNSFFGQFEVKSGKFEIKDKTIHLIPDDGSEETEHDYTYNEETGTLTLWWSKTIQLKKQ